MLILSWALGFYMQLRPYQQSGVESLRAAFAEGHRAVLYVLPTGGGKTFTFAFVTKNAVAKGRRVLIVVHRQELLAQASRALAALGVEHGRIAPGFHGELEPVAVASVQTLDRRLRRGPLNFDFIILDEAHHVGASTWERVLGHFTHAHVLGVTATPIRLDGRGLGKGAGGVFDKMILGPTMKELTAEGHLVPAVLYSFPPDFDTEGVRKSKGDFNTRDLAKKIDKPKITGSAVDHYRELAPDEPAIAFCASLEHADHVAAQFRAGGYHSEVIHGGLPDGERKRMVEELANGKIKVLASVDLISEGTDIPVCSVAILLRKTLSTGLYLQQVGRILRPAPGKTRGLVLDHVGNYILHGRPADTREWTLEGAQKKQVENDGVTVRQCKKCFAVYEKGLRCPYCGSVNIVEARTPTEGAGELREITEEEVERLKLDKKRAYATATSYAEVLALTKKFGDKPGFAHHYWKSVSHKRQKRSA